MYAGQIVEIRELRAAARRPAAPLHRGARPRPGRTSTPDRAPAARDPRPAAVGVRGAGGRVRVRAPGARTPATAAAAARRRWPSSTAGCPAALRAHELRGQLAGRRAAPMPDQPPAGACEVAGLRKEFGAAGRRRRRVVHGAGRAGSLAIVGESGSGKTTIARMIVGLERPTAGTIGACGHDRSRPARSRAGPAPPRPRGADRLPGPVHQPGPAADRRGRDRRGAAAAPRLGRGAPPGAGRRAHRPGRARRPAVPGAAAGAVRRAAAAGGDRPGAGRRAAGADPGRVRGRAGRVHPGAGAEPARRHPGRTGVVLRADQPRPRGGAAAHRPGDRAVPRPGRRARPDRRASSTTRRTATPGCCGPASRGRAGNRSAACWRPRQRTGKPRDGPALPVRDRGAGAVPGPRAVPGRADDGGDRAGRGGRAVINAFAATRYDEALDAARAAEARYAGSGPPPRPLEGLPVAVKEEAPIAGQLNTLGSLPLRDVVADHTAAFVQRILDAGGIVHAGPPPRSSAARRSPGRSCGA